MTISQTRAIEKIKAYILKHDLYNEDYEIKKFEVEETDYGSIIIYSVAGMKNDEGTMAEVLCRNIRQIFIGRNGGLRCCMYNQKTKKSYDLKGFNNVMISGYRH